MHLKFDPASPRFVSFAGSIRFSSSCRDSWLCQGLL